MRCRYLSGRLEASEPNLTLSNHAAADPDGTTAAVWQRTTTFAGDLAPPLTDQKAHKVNLRRDILYIFVTPFLFIRGTGAEGIVAHSPQPHYSNQHKPGTRRHRTKCPSGHTACADSPPTAYRRSQRSQSQSQVTITKSQSSHTQQSAGCSG